MSSIDATHLALHNIKQAFDDFISHDAERAIAEATRDAGRAEQLWVVLYADGRYGTEHLDADRALSGVDVVGRGETGAHVAFPIEPLAPEALDPRHLEDSCFDEAIESLWRAYDTAIQRPLNV